MEASVSADVNAWLERFRAFDAQGEEAIDQGAEYGALLREQTPNPERRSYPTLNPERRSNRYRSLLGEQTHGAASVDGSTETKSHERSKLH